MLTFTNSGFLTPAESHLTTVAELYDVFVRPFPISESRGRLFQNWITYNRMLRQEIGIDFTQWVDGSFVTQKQDPRDIDLVSFIPLDLFHKFEKRLDYYWTDNWEPEGIDAYFVVMRNPEEMDYRKTMGDIEDWHRRYTRTKPTSGQPSQPKGFLIIHVQ